MKILAIIPSRYASTRFPGKPLVEIDGKSMVQRVYEQVLKVKSISKVIIATDNDRILNHVQSWGGNVVMTSVDHKSGTDRCNEVLSKEKEHYDVIVNIQGDEPYIDPSQIENVTETFVNKETQIASLAKKISSNKELFNPNSVKVVIGMNKQALYFSRSTIPFLRGIDEKDYLKKGEFYKHIGLYAYSAKVLKEICKLKPSRLELAESLEQLRWLEAGYEIKMGLTEKEGISVDSPEDLLQLNNKA